MHAVDIPNSPEASTATETLSPERLEALRRTHLLDTDPEEAFDRTTRLVTRLTGAPSATVTLIDRERQFYKSVATTGIWRAGRETPLSHSFCRHVVEEQAPFRVCDARTDARVCANPAIDDFDVVAYLGVPLRAPSGEILGSLCAIDSGPRAWTDEDQASLEDLAAVLTDEIERRQTVQDLFAEERAHADERALVRASFDAIRDMFYVLDMQGCLVRWNERLSAVTGYDDEELRGMGPEQFFASGDHVRAYDALGKVMQNGHALIEATVRTKSGAEIPYEISGSLLRGGDGEVVGICGVGRDISERQRAENALRLSEARYRGLIEATPDLFFRLSREGRYLDIQSLNADLLIGEKAQLLGQTIFDVLPEPLASRLHRASVRALDTGEPQDTGYALTTRDGNEHDFEVRIVSVGADEVQAVVRDVTKQKAAERAIRESEVRFRSFVEATAQVVWQANAEGVSVELSGAWKEFTGQTLAEIEGLGWADALHPDDRERVGKEWADVVAAKKLYVTEYRARRRDGAYHRFSVRGVPVWEGDTFTGWVGTSTDVEAQRQAEEAAARHEEGLKQRERLLQGIAKAHASLLGDDLETAVSDAFRALGEVTHTDRVYIFEMFRDAQTGSTMSSQRFEWAREGVSEQIGNPGLQNFQMEEVGLGRWEQELNQGRLIVGPVHSLPASERQMLREQDIQSILVAPISIDGAVWGFIGFDDCHSEREWSAIEQAILSTAASGVGEAILRQRQRVALAESELRLRQALDSARMGSWDTFLQTGATTVSARTLSLFGLPEGEAYDSTFWRGRVLDEDKTTFMSARNEAIAQAEREGAGSFTVEFRGRREDGAVRWFRAMGRVQTDDTRTAQRITGTLQDVTDEKTYADALIEAKDAAESARARAEETARMKSVLLANMSHEIRTPLTSIIGFADMLATEVTGEHLEFVERIVKGGRRLMHTLTSVLDLAQMEAGRRDLELSLLDVQDVVTGAAELFRTQAEAKGLAFEVSQPDGPAVILGEEAALHRVIANLVSNAIKFTESGHVSLSTSVASGAVTVRVEDSGVGIAETFVPVLFEEFRQESEGESRRFEGNGLGLAISKRLVEMMGGTIQVRSEKDVGSTFVVRIPLAG